MALILTYILFATEDTFALQSKLQNSKEKKYLFEIHFFQKHRFAGVLQNWSFGKFQQIHLKHL